MPAPTRGMCGFHSAPLGYAQAVAIYQTIMVEAGVAVCDILNGLHHLRGLMIVLCAHAGHAPPELKVIGNWRADNMSNAYSGFAREIPLQMVRRLLGSARSGWRPAYEGAESAIRGSRVELVGENFLETPLNGEAPTQEQIDTARAKGEDAIAAIAPPPLGRPRVPAPARRRRRPAPPRSRSSRARPATVSSRTRSQSSGTWSRSGASRPTRP